jgi:hypothetical protein
MPFKALSQFHVGLSDFAQPLPGIRVVEGLGTGQDFFSTRSQVHGLQ